ncbi:MAG: sugar phosphate nucleotidyltransferase [Gaiellaceae bacterium]
MKVVLFCGGQGMRLRGAVGSLPKPMVPIGGRPLLWHIMKYYAHFGHREFLVCVGHQAAVIKDYFERTAHGWHVEFVDTPLEASIGERLYAVQDRLAGEKVFLANYGDTVTDVPLPVLIDYHAEHGKVASLLAVRPNYTFNVVEANGPSVTGFHDIAQSGIWINGGYFVFRADIFDYLGEGEDMPEMFERLIAAGQLVSYPYEGFWAPMDTLKDKQNLESLVESGGSVWQVWERSGPAAASA